MPKVVLICDLQFGSTGKGLIAGYLAKRTKPDTLVTAWAPNAGHTFIDSDGRKFVHRMVPNGIVSPRLKHVLIGPGSVIDLGILNQELKDSFDLLAGCYVMVHENAAVVLPRHIDEEKKTLFKIGSTQKGTAVANINKMMRDPASSNTMKDALMYGWGPTDLWERIAVVNHETYCQAVDSSKIIQLEGAQGYSLGINSGFYPYTTSRECTPAQMMSDCAIPLKYLHQVVGTMRTYPIRVANRYDAQGNMIGTSGPGYPDQIELSWDQLGIEPELTTVTKLPRRVFTFSPKQIQAAIRACAPDFIFLNFVNYTKSVEELKAITDVVDAAIGHQAIMWHGMGPTENDVHVQHLPEFIPPGFSTEWANKRENDRVIR